MNEQENEISKSKLITISVVLLIASLLFVLDYSISSVILPYVIGDLGARYEQGTYIVTTFSIGNAFAIPPLFFLVKRFGERRMMVMILLLFPLVSFLCGITDSFNLLLFLRFILGVISGPILPLSLFILLDTFPKKHHGMVFGIWSSVLILAPMIGPLIGGFLTTVFSWRVVFISAVPIGIICGLVLAYELDLEKKGKWTSFDFFGYFLLVIISATSQFMMDKGQQWDWHRSKLVLCLAGACLLSLILLIVWTKHHTPPVLDFALLKKKNFLLSIIVLIFSYSSFFGTIVLVPLWLETYMGYDAFTAGLANAPLGIMPVILAPFNHIFMRYLTTRQLLFISMCIFAASTYWCMNFYVDIDLYHIQMSRFFNGFGFAIFLAPLLTLSLEDVSEEEKPQALIFFHYVRTSIGALGTGLLNTVWTRRTVFHRQFLTEFVNVLNPYVDKYIEASKKVRFFIGDHLALINRDAENQGRVLGLLDVFFVITCFYCCAALCIFLWWLVPKIYTMLTAKEKTQNPVIQNS
jgi:DHA2 family multidrug resistance protein